MSNVNQISVRAPSNIALIKYMGKADPEKNLAENPSISLTLKNLCSWVEVHFKEQQSQDAKDCFEWQAVFSQPQQKEKFIIPQLDDLGKEKIWRHFSRVRNECRNIFPQFGLKMKELPFAIQVRSANSFPEASGIASSASSFAALTLAFAAGLAVQTEKGDSNSFQKIWEQDTAFKKALAKISRQASGSSCRSFQGPWVYWESESISVLDSKNFPKLAHFVILVSQKSKAISSSQAHLLIKTSPLWKGRVERVSRRIELFLKAFEQGDWNSLVPLAWEEMWEMHSLFHTASVPFTYWEPGSLQVLNWIVSEKLLSSTSHSIAPPIVTMDAGPNIHFIVQEKDRNFWREGLKKQFSFDVLEDVQGTGPELRFGEMHGF